MCRFTWMMDLHARTQVPLIGLRITDPKVCKDNLYITTMPIIYKCVLFNSKSKKKKKKVVQGRHTRKILNLSEIGYIQIVAIYIEN